MTEAHDAHAEREPAATHSHDAREDREPTAYDMQWPRAPLNWTTARWWFRKATENDPAFWPMIILGAVIFIPMAGWLLIRELIEFLQHF